jgi:hypothetical protein
VLENSLDGANWNEIDRQTSSSDEMASFSVSNSAECRFIRLTQTGKNCYGRDWLSAQALEVFGILLR